MADITTQFTVQGNHINRTDHEILSVGSLGITAEFIVSEEWADAALTAQFTPKGTTEAYQVDLDVVVTDPVLDPDDPEIILVDSIITGSCIIPTDALRLPGMDIILIGVVSSTKKLVTEEIYCSVVYGLGDQTLMPPSQSEYDALLAAYKETQAQYLASQAAYETAFQTALGSMGRLNTKTNATTLIQNTTTESIMHSAVIPHELFIPGASFMVKLAGYLSFANNVGSTVRIYLGNTLLATSVGTTPVAATNSEAAIDFGFTIRDDGTLIGEGHSSIYAGQSFSTAYHRSLVMINPVTIDFSNDLTLKITYQWGTAAVGNSSKTTNCWINYNNGLNTLSGTTVTTFLDFYNNLGYYI